MPNKKLPKGFVEIPPVDKRNSARRLAAELERVTTGSDKIRAARKRIIKGLREKSVEPGFKPWTPDKE